MKTNRIGNMEKKSENHYHREQYGEIPSVRINYQDANRTIEIEVSNYNLEEAFNSAMFVLDERLLINREKEGPSNKDNMIG